MTANRSAEKNNAIYFCVDKKFFPYAMFVAKQISDQNPHRDFDICILSAEKLPEHALIDELNLRIIQLNTDDLASNVATDERISFAAYLRIIAPIHLHKDYKKLIYLDADLFILNANFSQLFSIEFAPHPVAAVKDMNQIRKPERIPPDFAHLGMGFAKYFNSGFLLIDCKEYINQDICAKALKFAVENKNTILQHDQTVLNVVLRDNWAELSWNWNYEYSHQTAFFLSLFDAQIIHFVGQRKPWNQNLGVLSRRFTEPYRSFFSQHFPHLAADVQNGLSLKNNRKMIIGSLIFHLLNAYRFLPLDEKFKDLWDIKFPNPNKSGKG